MAEPHPPDAAPQDAVAAAKSAYIAGLRKLLEMAGAGGQSGGGPDASIPPTPGNAQPVTPMAATSPAPSTPATLPPQIQNSNTGPAQTQFAPNEATSEAPARVVPDSQVTKASGLQGQTASTGAQSADETSKGVDEFVRKATSQLGEIQRAVNALIVSNFLAYVGSATRLQREYEDKAKKESAVVEAVASILLSLPFFYAADFIGKAVAGAITSAAPMIAGKLNMGTDAVSEMMKKLLVPTAAQKTVEEVFKEGRKGLSKDVAADSVAPIMAKYAATIVYTLSQLQSKLCRRVNSMKMDEIGSLAAIHSAMEIKTPEVFEDELTKHLDRYEKQVAPVYMAANTFVNDVSMGATTLSRKIAIIPFGTEKFRAQVKKLEVFGEPFSKGSEEYEFVCWVELMDGVPEEDSSRVIPLQRKDVKSVPSGQPPATAKV